MKFRLFILFLFVNISYSSNAQQFLQIEMRNSVDTKKFHLGQALRIKTVHQREWFDITMKKFDYENNLIIHESGYLHLDEITDILTYRRVVKQIGDKLQQFAVVYAAYNVFATLRDGPNPGGYIIAGGTIVIAWIFKKLFHKRKYKIGKRYSLRLLDLRLN